MTKTKRQAMYGVKFVGYLADVIARKYGREVEYASLDFVSGGVSVHGNGGWVAVSKRIDLGPFVKSLPELTSELQDLLHQRDGQLVQENAGLPAPATGKSKMIRLSCGPNSVSVAGRHGNQTIHSTSNQAIYRGRASTRTSRSDWIRHKASPLLGIY